MHLSHSSQKNGYARDEGKSSSANKRPVFAAGGAIFSAVALITILFACWFYYKFFYKKNRR